MPPKNPAGRDIRNYFGFSSTSKASASQADTSAVKREESKPKKKPVIIESDSDSDGPFSSKPPKKAKKEEPPAAKPSTAAPKPAKVKKEPEAAPKSVDIKDVFGSTPIQRSKEAPEKRKRPLEEHGDKDFEATLAQLDEAVPSKKSKLLDKGIKEEKNGKESLKIVSPEKSPVKSTPPLRTSPRKSSRRVEEPMEEAPPAKNGKAVKEEKVTPSKKQPVKEEKKTPVKQTKSEKTATPTKNGKETKKESVTPKGSKKPTGKKESIHKLTVDSPPAKKKEKLDSEDAIPSSPSVDPLEKRRQQAENYRKFVATHREGAKNPGSKPVPEGADGCLTGLTIVVTGVLESLQREEAEDLIKRYGGKATKSISRNTSHVLAGEDAGPSKLSKAKELNIPLITEDDFLNMIATRPGGSGPAAAPSPAGKGKKAPPTPKSLQKESGARKKTPAKSPEPVVPSEPTPKMKKEEPPASSSSYTALKDPAEATLPWVDKYKPASVKQIIGLQGDRSNAKKLLHWLQHWSENHSGHKKLTRPSPWSTTDDGGYFKAALLSGPPGIGKTTTAHLVSKELGFDIVEMNASDTRSKRLLHEHVKELLSCQSLTSFAHGAHKIDAGRKRVLIMDEVDGMAGTEDRGGMQELIGLIKSSKVPIICICNDRQHPKVRSLANYCYDLKFQKPRVEQIRGAMMSICFKEGLKMKPEALDEIIVGANQDVRQVLHHLSMIAKGQGLTPEQAKVEASKTKKDFKLGPWDVVKKVYSIEEHKSMSMHDKTDLFFQDYSFGPLFAQENYPQVAPQASRGNAIETLNRLGKTAHCFSETDLIEKVIRSQNAWSLLPVEAIFASVMPGQLMEGYIGGQIQFPQWLGKNSRTNKMDRLLQELQIHTRLRISASKRALNMDYLPCLVRAIVGPLRKDGAEGVKAAIQAMESYDLLREDLDSLCELSQWPNKPEIMAGIDGKVKAAFTRAYNKEAHMTPYAAGRVKAGKSSSASKSAEEELVVDEEEMEGENPEEEEEEDNIEMDAMIKVKKKPTTTTAGAKSEKATASGSSGRGGRGRGRGGSKK